MYHLLKEEEMKDNRMDHIEPHGTHLEIEHTHHENVQEGMTCGHDTLNGNDLLRQLLADEIAEGM